MKPLNTATAAVMFALPSAAVAIAVYVTIPLTLQRGIPLALTVTGHFLLVLGGLGLVALWAANREGHGRGATLRRLRLEQPSLNHLALGLGLGGFSLVTYLWLSSMDFGIDRVIPLNPPAWLGAFSTKLCWKGLWILPQPSLRDRQAHSKASASGDRHHICRLSNGTPSTSC